MDNMKDKFAQFSGMSIMLVSASMTLFTRLVDGYYELKNVLSIFYKIYKLNKINKPIITWRKRLAENKSISKI